MKLKTISYIHDIGRGRGGGEVDRFFDLDTCPFYYFLQHILIFTVINYPISLAVTT